MYPVDDISTIETIGEVVIEFIIFVTIVMLVAPNRPPTREVCEEKGGVYFEELHTNKPVCLIEKAKGAK